MAKKKINYSSIQGIMIDGTEFVTKTQASMMAGVSIPTFNVKAKKYGIKEHPQSNGKVLFIKENIVDAIRKGLFNKWVMA